MYLRKDIRWMVRECSWIHIYSVKTCLESVNFCLRDVMESDKWKQINFDIKALVLNSTWLRKSLQSVHMFSINKILLISKESTLTAYKSTLTFHLERVIKFRLQIHTFLFSVISIEKIECEQLLFQSFSMEQVKTSKCLSLSINLSSYLNLLHFMGDQDIILLTISIQHHANKWWG